METVEKIFDGLKQFDVDSEVFELTFALIKQNNELKYQNLINYIFEKCNEELGISDLNKISAFNILTLGMRVITGVEYRNKYIDFLITNKEYIINQSNLLNDRIYEVITSNNEYCEKIDDEYSREAKLKIISSVFSSMKQIIIKTKRLNNVISENRNLFKEDHIELSMVDLAKYIKEEIIYSFNNCFYCNLYILYNNIQNFFIENINFDAFNYLINNTCFNKNKLIDENIIELYNQYEKFDDELKRDIANAINKTLIYLKERTK